MTQNIGRLALRVEGEFWNAYWSPSETSMEGAVLLASIRMSVIVDSPVRKKEFMTLAIAAFGDAVKDATGQRPTMGHPEAAPERERAGSA